MVKLKESAAARTHHEAHNVLIAELKDVRYRIDAQKETERLKVILVEVQAEEDCQAEDAAQRRGGREGGSKGEI